MPQVYGKKSRAILQKDFFNGTPEPRRSPRLRKVLVEQSSNIQRLDSSPPTLSPCAQKSRPIKVQQQKGLIYEDGGEDEDEEPVKQPPRWRQVRNNTKNGLRDDETEALAKALGLLDLEELKELSSSSKHTTDDISDSQSRSRSSSTTLDSISSNSTSSQITQQTISIPQHPAKLKPETLTYIAPLLQCKNFSQTIESFSGWVTARQPLLTFVKIGEGSYGQVFRATDSSGATVIIKLMPLNAARGRRWQTFTSVDAAATEVKLLAKMQKVPGFVEYRGGCILQGSMPEPFMALWDEYRDAGRTLESQDPRIKGTYPSTQLWLMLEMSDAGTNLEPGHYLPLESLEECLSDKRGKQAGSKRTQKKKRTWADKGKYLSINRVWDIFWQVVFAVAKAEAYCRFEHRDLHLGNICVKDDGHSLAQQSSRKRSTLPMPITSTGTTITIIDYTLSRADASAAAAPAMAFDFQADACLLSGQGDLQYDMYRWMDEVIGDRGCGTYDPRTNVVWFYHLLVKLLNMAIPLVTGDGADKTSNEKAAKAEVDDDAEYNATDDNDDSDGSEEVEDESEEEDLGEDSEIFRSETAEQAMLRVLQEVRALTDPTVIRTWVANSAGDLLKHAFAKDWLVADGL